MHDSSPGRFEGESNLAGSVHNISSEALWALGAPSELFPGVRLGGRQRSEEFPTGGCAWRTLSEPRK